MLRASAKGLMLRATVQYQRAIGALHCSERASSGLPRRSIPKYRAYWSVVEVAGQLDVAATAVQAGVADLADVVLQAGFVDERREERCFAVRGVDVGVTHCLVE